MRGCSLGRGWDWIGVQFRDLYFKYRMSNVHGFGQGSGRRIPPINRQNQQGNQDQQSNFNILPQGFGGDALEEQLRLAEEHKVLFVSGRRSLKNPREENYWDMLVFGLCPTFQFLSLTFLIILADIALFIFQLSKGLDTASSNLLQIKLTTAIGYGGNYYPSVRTGQVYRLLSAVFLHANFMHIFGNLLVTFMFLSRVEYSYGVVKTLIVYVVSGIAGNVFRLAIVRDQGVSVGASTALFGIIGVIIGYIIINWNGLDLLGPVIKCQIYCTAFMIIMFILIFTPSNLDGNIDYYGHLGGFLGGMWLSAIHTTIGQGRCETVTRIIFLSLLVIQLLVCFLVLYLTANPYS